LTETAELADQYNAVHRASRGDRKPHEGKLKQMALQSWVKPPASAVTTSQSSQKSPEPQKKAATLLGTKVMCYYSKKPRRILAHCKKRLAKLTGASTS